MRVVFMGTPDFSVPTLRAIADAGHEVVAVYTQPPRPAGRRGLETVPSPVQQEASIRGLAVYTPLSLKEQTAQDQFRSLNADVAVVVAYGLLLPEPILNGTRLGCYNGHASLLPRWRGAAPIQRAIMAGDNETGMMIMKMDRGLDTGPVALSKRVEIGPDTIAGELHDQLKSVGAALMVQALSELEQDKLTLTPQPTEGILYASKIEKAETRIEWSKPASEVHNHIRGLSPFPGAWYQADAKAERVKVLRSTLAEGSGEPGTLLAGDLTVACGRGAVRLLEIQRAGGKPMPAQEFLRGAQLKKGMILQ